MANGRRLAEQERAVQEVIVQMFGLLLCAGKNDDEMREYAHSCIEAAKFESRDRLQLSSRTDAQEFGNILRTWHRLAQFLTKDGYPRPLRLAGPNGLKRLITRYYPNAEVETVFGALRSAGLIERIGGGRWIPTRRHAVFPKLTTELLTHLSEGVSRLVETVIGNVTAEQKDEVLFERSAKVRKFPMSAAGDFRAFVNTQAASFLGAIDDWMEAQADLANRKKGRKCTAGVFTFAFMDPLAGSSGHQSALFHQRRKRVKGRGASHPSAPVSRSSPRSSSAGRS